MNGACISFTRGQTPSRLIKAINPIAALCPPSSEIVSEALFLSCIQRGAAGSRERVFASPRP